MRRRRWMAGAAAGVVGMAGFLAGPIRADFDPEAWRISREVKVLEGATGEHARFALDKAVWDRAAGPGLQDLRVLRDETDDIGYAIYAPQKPQARLEKRTARVFNIATRGREASELTLDLGEDPPITNRIEILTPAENFRCPVTIEGSDDRETWKTLRADAAIFAFTGDVAERFTAVSFPDARLRYLRVVVAAPTGGDPIDLTGANIFQEVKTQEDALPLLCAYDATSRTDTDAGRETWITIDLGAKHLPVSRVELGVSEANFSRPVRVDVGNDLKMPTQAGSGVVFRYETARYRESHLAVEFPEAFGRYVRLRILDGDDPPLAVPAVTVSGRPRYIFFPFEPGHAYQVFYGNPSARPAQYDYAKVFQHIDRAAVVEARLGESQVNPRFIATKAARPPHPWLVRNQWVLYAGLGVAVIGLVLVAVRALRQAPADDKKAGD